MRARLFVTLAVATSLWSGAKIAAAQYRDTFEDEKLGSLPSHWMESEPDENWKAPPPHWRVVAAPDRPGGHALLADQMQGGRKALLHTFGSNIQLEADVLVVRSSARPQAQLSVLARTNSDRDRIELTYSFASRAWELRERTGIRKVRDGKLINNPSRLLATTEAPLPIGWNHIEITAVQRTLIAKLNGRELLSAANVEHLSYGRVGFEVRYAEVMFDDVAYSGDGEGRVHDGVKEIGNMHNELYSEIFETPDGILTIKSNQEGWGVLQSKDDGDTWEFRHDVALAGHPLNQVAVFENKHVITISPIAVTDGQYRYETIASADGGNTWAPSGRLPRDAAPGYAEAGKLRTCGTRSFFFIDYGRKQGTQLYYSDDEGASWMVGAAFTPAAMPQVFQKIRRIEAPHLVSCGEDQAAIFLRTNRDYHYRSTTEDRGLTWSEPSPVFALRSSLSDAGFDYDPSDKSIYAVFMYELRRDPPGCKKSEGQWPRERMVLARSSDCGATWSYLMDVDNWEGNDARFNQMVLRVLGDYVWISADTHVASAPNACGGAAYMQSTDGRSYDWRRLYRIDKRKLQPLPSMPLLLTR